MNDQDNRYGPVIACVFENNLSKLQAMLSRGITPNELDNDGRTPLHHAAIDNKLEIAELLLKSGTQVDVQDKLGNSALHYAAQNYHPEMATLLLSYDAPIDAEDIYGNTPLWRAVFNSKGRGELIVLLLKAGANKNHHNKHGKTPLELAKNIANFNVFQFFS